MVSAFCSFCLLEPNRVIFCVDPQFRDQWHIKNNDQGHDLNIEPTWAMNIYGSGVGTLEQSNVDLINQCGWLTGLFFQGICIIDDGLEWRHPDFRYPPSQPFAPLTTPWHGRDADGTSRYNKSASHDWNGNDDDPSPGGRNDAHGTRNYYYYTTHLSLLTPPTFLSIECGGLAFAGAFNRMYLPFAL